MTQGSSATKGDVMVLLGTRKGAFILSSGKSRKNWQVSGPHSPGSEVFHLSYDHREGGTVFAAVNHMIWGPTVQRSRDLGTTWLSPQEPSRFTSGAAETIDQVWHLEPGREGEPGVVYLGVAPAGLFKSDDYGSIWQEVASLSKHPSRDQWQPGLGGLCLHSIVLDPADASRMWVGISAVGVFGTTDSGESWETLNQGVRADFLPDRFPDFGQCPHKVLTHPSKPGLLYQQNHCGVYKSESAGEEWQDITEGLPSRFGFVLGLHSQDPDTLFVLPEDQVLGEDVGGGQRYVTEAKFRVYRSQNGGRDCEPLTQGLPQENAYLHVLREGMATDSLDDCGVYVGTTTGQLFYSRDNGDNWELLIEHLPPILSVECGSVA